MTHIDVIIPAHNALEHVRECVLSVLRHRKPGVRLILVDDCSHDHVRDEIEKLIEGENEVQLKSLPQSVGYLEAMNAGIAVASAPLVIMLNSDTIIFEGFFDRIEATFESNEDIGIVNPVSIWANWTRIPFPSGQSIHSLHTLTGQTYGDEIVDIHNASGFCFAIRKDLLDRFGPFDPIFSPGYWEETDLCMKVLEAGYKVVCARGIFVYHHGWGSFGGESRNRGMDHNEGVFRRRWGDKYDRLEQWFKGSNPLRDQISNLNMLGPEQSNVALDTNEDGSLSVLYVLNDMGFYGGVISILQVVNRLVLEGVRANIAVYGAISPDVLRYGPTYVSPLQFESEADLIENCPPVDIIIATHWSTAYPVAKLFGKGRCQATAYFVQDYEPDFHEPGTEDYRMASLSYDLIHNRICKTPWLRRKLDSIGGRNEIIPLGLDLDVFADFRLPRARQVISLARPSSERRNWPTTRRVFEAIRATRPDIECAVFGFGYSSNDLPTGTYDYGMLRESRSVSKMLNECTVLLDCSTYQGFGRPGLEAMACGAASVLTKNGGITSYAKHRFNCLLIDPTDITGIVSAVLRVFDDDSLRRELREQAKETASLYSHRQEGLKTKAFLESLLPTYMSSPD